LLTGWAVLGLASAAAQSRPADLYGPPVAICELSDQRIQEASGIAASRRNPGCYYVHNDSGDQPQVFLIDRSGRTRLTIRLRGAQAVDWEDIAIAPGRTPGAFDVCVADIGDNFCRRSELVIYRFAEVALDEQPDGKPVYVEPIGYRLRYASGPADAEAFCVDPRSGDAYIVTKGAERAAVYRLPAPWDAQQPMVLKKLMDLELPSVTALSRTVTAADVSPDGRHLAVRCYVDGWEWRLPYDAGETGFLLIFGTAPQRLSLPPEPQGEALCYSADGRSLLTISEGSRPVLYELSRIEAERGAKRACASVRLVELGVADMLGVLDGGEGRSERAR